MFNSSIKRLFQKRNTIDGANRVQVRPITVPAFMQPENMMLAAEAVIQCKEVTIR